MFTKINQPTLWSSLLQDLHSLELYFMPPSFLDINTIIHEKLEKNTSIPLSVKNNGFWNLSNILFNILEPEFYIQILAHLVGKMRIIQ